MAVYKPYGKTASGKEEIKIPYSSIDGTPTIPTVHDGTLTIQKNGTTVKTFSANQSGNVTANITFHLYEHNIYLSCSNTTSTTAPSRAYIYFTVITTSATACNWNTLTSLFVGIGAYLNAGGFGSVGDPEGSNNTFNATVQSIIIYSNDIYVEMVYNNSLLGVDNTYSTIIFSRGEVTVTDKVRTIL